MTTIQIKKLTLDAILPKKNHATDAAFDLYSNEEIIIPAKGRATIKTGIAIAFPPGHVLFVKDRSGLASKEGLTTMAGVIDAGYRGEYMVVIHNTTNKDYKVTKGHRIAQAIILQLPETIIEEVNELPDSDRGEKGFGSSGK